LKTKILILILTITLLINSINVFAVTDADIQQGNRMWFNFKNETGSLSGWTIIDKSGRANGTLHNVQCDANKCDFLNGSSYVDFSSLSHNNLSALVWVNLDDHASTEKVMLTKDNTASHFLLEYQSTGGANSFSSGTTSYSASSGVFSELSLLNIIVTYDNGVVHYYLNGTSADSDTSASTGNIETLKIGRETSNTASGDYYIVAMWNRTLSATEITYIQGKGKDYNPYSTGGATSSNVSLTLENTWNNASITTFNATLTNATTTLYYGTTTGTITTEILQNSTELWNINYTVASYFNNSYSNINVSANHEGRVNQSIINVTVRNIVDNSTFSNYTVYFNTTIFCNTTTTVCLNNPLASSYSVNATPNDGVSFHNPASQINITALQNNTITLYAHEHQANITARDVTTNATISTFNINVRSYNTSYEANYTTTSGYVEAYFIHNLYNITIDATGYALYNNSQNLSVTSDYNITFYLQKENGVAINIYDESTGLSMNGTNVTVYTYFNTTSLIYTNLTLYGNISFYNLTPGNYTFRFEADNYAVKEYYVEVGNRSFQYLNAYMLQTTYSTIFTFLDETNGNTIQDALVTVSRYINGSLVVVSSLTSDITGRVQLSYEPSTPYYFTITRTNYTTKEFTLNPILFSSYNVKLTPTTSQSYEGDYSGVSITYTPNYLTDGLFNNVSFTFSSPPGALTEYGFNISFNSFFNESSGVNAYGGNVRANINISDANVGETAQVKYYYTTSDGDTNSYAFNMEIRGVQSLGNYTMASQIGQTYGLGNFERIIIVTIILLLVIGSATMFSGAFVGGVMGMFVMGFFGYMGFISLWAVIPSMVFLFMFSIWGGSR